MMAQLGSTFPDFRDSLAEPTPVSIRINTWKSAIGKDSYENLEPVSWHPNGRYLPERPVFTLDPLFHAGAYYVQEASSMALHFALQQITRVRRPLRILDLCASPGGKSTLLASWMPEHSLLLSNEVIQSRVGPLQDNMERWGYANTFTCSYDPAQFDKLTGFFDIVLVDAPCSGEGLFRKDPDAVNEWSEDQVKTCVARQRRILASAQKLVCQGGHLLFSTCTYNDQENEENAAWLAEKSLEPVKINFPEGWNVVDKKYGHQFYPHKVRGEGFYFAVFRQTEGVGMRAKLPRQFSGLNPIHKRQIPILKNWVKASDQYFHLLRPDETVLTASLALQNDLLLLDHLLPKGVWMKDIGQFKGNDFIPSHALALNEIIGEDLASIDLGRSESLHFLRKETVVLQNVPKGWLLVRYEGTHLGWIKNIGNRINNYFPKEWRIRMEVEEVATR